MRLVNGLPGGWRSRMTGAAVAAALMAFATPALGLVVELKDDAPDRIERQRAWVRGALPLAHTPDLANLDARLAAKGLTRGAAVFVRIFKAESELELWLRKGDRFVLLDTYPICHWTGSLGPKEREGDRQSPEGFYTVTPRQARHLGRWRKALNLGFPNVLDRRLERTGSYILLHGGCSSTGCFAMTDPVMDEIHELASAALRAKQDRIHVHIFPFRMTAAALEARGDHPWRAFWDDLKAGYDAFERTQLPPRVAVCGKRYVVRDGAPGERRETRASAAALCTEQMAQQAQSPTGSTAARQQ